MQTRLAALMVGIGVVCGWSRGVAAQDPEPPTVPIVQSIGSAEVERTTWFLTRATEPTESDTPYSSDSEIEEAQTVSLGSNRFQLIGVAEFLDVEGLLDQFQRADFTARESVNSTGQLKAQHKLLIKGLYIQDADPSRINITSVINLADSCS